MAYQRYYGYEYETSPRKLQPEYEPIKRNKPYKGKKSSTYNSKKNKQEDNPLDNSINSKKIAKNNKIKIKNKIEAFIFVGLAFAILFGISYRNSLITEKFNEKEELKEKLAVIQKENEQLKVSIESSLNLSNVEQMAKEKLGMQKLDNKQKVYVNLPKKDYIESATEEVLIEEELGFWQKIWKNLIQNIK